MNYSDLLFLGLNSWPDKILISDGENISIEGGYFPTLSKTWKQIEELEEKKGSIEALICWAIFSGFHKSAISLFLKKELVSKNDLDHTYIHQKFTESFYAKAADWSHYHKDWNDDYQIK